MLMLLLIFLLASTDSAVADSAVLDDLQLVKDIKALTAGKKAATFTELVRTNGYSAEAHHVTTKDGYVLEVHRITGSSSCPPAQNKSVVFLMHGLLGNSVDWVIMGPTHSLGYILADEGYDVWMGNARGNTWSRKNINNLSKAKFWNFSWHEIGTIDLPAMIDYVLGKTGRKTLKYIGHSQGTTSFFVMTSVKPEYNEKIEVMLALAPVAFGAYVKSPIIRVAVLALLPGSTLAEVIEHLLGAYEALPSDGVVAQFARLFCPTDALSQYVCSNVIFLIGGYDISQLNVTMLSTIFQYSPAGASTKQLIHYGQDILSGKFRRYDYGLKNLVEYGRLTPPEYDLSLVTAPVHLIYGLGDWLAVDKDIVKLSQLLGNMVKMREVSNSKWSHCDFLWGTDVKKLVYDDIVATLKQPAHSNNESA